MKKKKLFLGIGLLTAFTASLASCVSSNPSNSTVNTSAPAVESSEPKKTTAEEQSSTTVDQTPSANPTPSSNQQQGTTSQGGNPTQGAETPSTYTYSFYSGSQLVKSETIEEGNTIVAPENPTKADDINYTYSFDGWYTSQTGGTKVTSFGAIEGNVSYFARFTQNAKKYNITWLNEDDSELASVSDAAYSTTLPVAAPTKASSNPEYVYVLSWQEEISGTNITRKAVFTQTANKFTVIWQNESGQTIETDEDVTYGSDFEFNGTTPAKSGYLFAYWTQNGTDKFDIKTNKVSGNITLRAVYLESYSVGFGGSYTSWSDLSTAAGVSTGTAFPDDVALNGFAFKGSTKQKVESSSLYNSQGAIIEVTLTGEVNELHMAAISGSGTDSVLKVICNDVELISKNVAKSGGNANFDLTGLPAGKYIITMPKTDNSGNASLKITTIYYSMPKEYIDVTFDEKGGSDVQNVKVVKSAAVGTLPTPTKSGYKFEGWYTSNDNGTTLDTLVTSSSSFDSNVTLYAKWYELTAEDLATVSFEFNISAASLSPIDVEKGTKLSEPTAPVIAGYRFAGWYTTTAYNTAFNFNSTINSATTVYGRYIQQFEVTYNDSEGQVITTKLVDIDTAFSTIDAVMAPGISGKIFDGWVFEGTTTKIVDSDDINSNITLVATYRDITPEDVKVEYVSQEGLQEAAYLVVKKYEGADGYSLYSVDGSNNLTKMSEKNYYFQTVNNNIRIDILGLTSGNHKFLVAPVLGGTDATTLGATSKEIAVEAYDRSGFAHFNYTDGVGAYKDNGELKDNAIVLYVTDENKNTVTLTYGGTTVTGIGNILNSVGADAGNGTASNGGSANTNQGILKKLGEAGIPLVVRFVGCVSNTGLYAKGTFDAANTPLINGLTIYDSINNGGTDGDNGHMARMKSAKNVTLEGVGSNATIDGWGFHFMAESSTAALGLGQSFEVRNLTFINTPEDAIGMEGVQASKNASSDLSASVERCWIHNNEFYGPSISNPAQSDKSEGDGSCDFKRGQYLTVSYNYFEGCHKTNLVGSADYSLQFNLSYHHNYWYLCKARGPLTRRANVHMYNNIFYGQTDYAMNTRADAYIFSESNLFYACKSPHAVEGGAIKSYNDSISSVIWKMGSQATTVTDKSQIVSNNCQFSARGIDYSRFDTDLTLSYIPSGNYYLQSDVTEARKVIYARTGVQKKSLIDISSVTMDDISYIHEAVPSATVHSLSVPSTTTNIGKISKTIYAFSISDYATVTIDTGNAGVLLNEAGVVMVNGNGSSVLAPGKYMVQAIDFQPGDAAKVTQPVFKEFNLNSLKLEQYDSSEFMEKMIAEFNTAFDNVPTSITYTDACYNAIANAMNKYNSLNADAKAAVASNYATLVQRYNEYKELGEDYVEGLINAIVTPVTASNSGNVIAARSAYNTLLNRISDAIVSNYANLVSAEAEMSALAVDIFLAQVANIPSPITYTSACETAIINAETAYASLDDDQIKQSNVKTAYATLTQARATYDGLESVNNVQILIDSANSLETYAQACTAYNALSTDQKSQIIGYSTMLVDYVNALIDAISTPVTNADAEVVAKAREMYDSLDSASQNNVVNYSKLTSAEATLEEIGPETVNSLNVTNFFDGTFTVTGATSTSGAVAGKVSKDNTIVVTSKVAVKNISNYSITVSTADKSSTTFKVYTSADGEAWTLLEDLKSTGNSGTPTVAGTKTVSSACFIKIEITSTKEASNSKDASLVKLVVNA